MDDYDIEQEELNDLDYHSNNKGPWKKIFKTHKLVLEKL